MRAGDRLPPDHRSTRTHGCLLPLDASGEEGGVKMGVMAHPFDIVQEDEAESGVLLVFQGLHVPQTSRPQ